MGTSFNIDQALSEWQLWSLDNIDCTAAPSVIRKFESGQNHQNYLVHVGELKVVVKIFNHHAVPELPAQRWACQLSLAPSIFFEDAERRYSVMDYLSGKPLAPRTISDESLSSLANSLTKLHLANYEEIEFVGKFDIHKFSQLYLKNAGERAALLHKRFEPALDLFMQDSTAWCLCHNDLNPANCFIRNRQGVFIDWEYAQIHNPWFDLAAIIAYLDLSPSQVEFFLKNYRDGWQNKIESEIFYRSQIALLWCDMLWYLSKYGESYWPELKFKYEQVHRCAEKLNV